MMRIFFYEFLRKSYKICMWSKLKDIIHFIVKLNDNLIHFKLNDIFGLFFYSI